MDISNSPALHYCQVDHDNPHEHYPRPQLVREQWRSLNGQWDFQIINKDEAMPEEFIDKITVPFCVESELSGVKRMNIVPTPFVKESLGRIAVVE